MWGTSCERLQRLLGVALITSKGASAGGSMSAQDLLALFDNDSPIKAFIQNSLELSPAVWSEIGVGSDANEKLGGLRLGPYHVLARPKDSNADKYSFILTVITENRFVDDKGEDVDFFEATVAKKKIVRIEIKEGSELQ